MFLKLDPSKEEESLLRLLVILYHDSSLKALNYVLKNHFSSGTPQGRKLTCCVADCPSPNDASFHKLPKDTGLKQLWLSAFKRKENINFKTAFVCDQVSFDWTLLRSCLIKSSRIYVNKFDSVQYEKYKQRQTFNCFFNFTALPSWRLC